MLMLPSVDFRLMVPPGPALPFACVSVLPSTLMSLPAETVTEPPWGPLAVMVLPDSSETDLLAESTMRPCASRLTWLALMMPLLRNSAPAMLMFCATSVPRFSALPAVAVNTTFTPGVAVSITSIDWPAASTICPFGAWISPEFETSLPTSRMVPPDAAVMLPWLVTLPWIAPASNLSLPAKKSAVLMCAVEATRPPTSMRAPWPKTMPFGLIKKTLPFDCSCPRIEEGSAPTTRLSTALDADCCWKLVISLAPIEKLCQLMTAPGLLVIVRVLPAALKVAWPLTTTGATGLAMTVLAMPPKAPATAMAWRFRRVANVGVRHAAGKGLVGGRLVIPKTPETHARRIAPEVHLPQYANSIHTKEK